MAAKAISAIFSEDDQVLKLADRQVSDLYQQLLHVLSTAIMLCVKFSKKISQQNLLAVKAVRHETVHIFRSWEEKQIRLSPIHPLY